MASFYTKKVTVMLPDEVSKEEKEFVFFKHQVDRAGIFDGRAKPTHAKLFPGEYKQFLDSLDPEKKKLLAFKGV